MLRPTATGGALAGRKPSRSWASRLCGNVTTSTYDPLRRVTQVVAPTSTGAITNTIYFPDGMVKEVDKATGIVATPWQVSTATYSVSGKKLTETDPNGHTTTYYY